MLVYAIVRSIAETYTALRERNLLALFKARSIFTIVAVSADTLPFSIRFNVSTRTPAAAAKSFCVIPALFRFLMIVLAILARVACNAGKLPFSSVGGDGGIWLGFMQYNLALS